MKKQSLPITIIGDGQLYRQNLSIAQRDETWVEKILQERNATIQDTWLLTVDKQGSIFFLPKEVGK